MPLSTHFENNVLHWQLNEPRRGNALGTTMASLIESSLNVLEKSLQTSTQEHDRARALIIECAPAGKNKQKICIAGGDLKELSNLKSKNDANKYASLMSEICHRLKRLPIPVIMAIDGALIGGGIEFAAFADLRFASSGSIFHFKQFSLGLSLGYGSSQRLASIVGEDRLLSLLLMEESISAETALDFGLIHKIYPSRAELQKSVKGICKKLINIETKTISAQKKIFSEQSQFYENKRKEEIEIFTSLWRNPSHQKFLDTWKKGKS